MFRVYYNNFLAKKIVRFGLEPTIHQTLSTLQMAWPDVYSNSNRKPNSH